MSSQQPQGKCEIPAAEVSCLLELVSYQYGGRSVLMPANEPHAVKAIILFKMLLTMIRSLPKFEA